MDAIKFMWSMIFYSKTFSFLNLHISDLPWKLCTVKHKHGLSQPDTSPLSYEVAPLQD